MIKNKIVNFFLLLFFVFICWTLCDYFLGFGFGVYFTRREFIHRLPWTILGCSIVSLYCVIEGTDLIKWLKRRKKKNNNFLNE